MQPLSLTASLYRNQLRDDYEIIKDCIKGSRKAQQELYIKYGQKMYAMCYRYAGNPSDAQDILQDGFIKVFDKIGTFKGESPLEGWMSRIFINLAITRFRSKARGPQMVELGEQLHALSAAEEDQLNSKFSLQQTIKAMEQLPDIYRMVLNMYAIDKLTHKEIAERMGTTEGTSKSQLSRARQMLKELLEGKKN